MRISLLNSRSSCSAATAWEARVVREDALTQLLYRKQLLNTSTDFVVNLGGEYESRVVGYAAYIYTYIHAYTHIHMYIYIYIPEVFTRSTSKSRSSMSSS